MSERLLPLVKSSLILLFILAYVMKSFFPLTFLPPAMALIVVLFFCIALPGTTSLNRNLIILLLCSSTFLVWPAITTFDWAAASIENAGIVTLLLTVPLLGAILHYAPYEEVIVAIANRYMQSNYVFYVITLGLVASLGSLMSLAAVPFAYQLLKPIAANYPAALLYKALSRGFAVNLFWAPNLICVAVVIRYLSISWTQLAMVGICFSLFSFIVACVQGRYELRYWAKSNVTKLAVNRVANITFRPEHKWYLLALLIQIVFVMAALTLLNRYGHKDIYVTVAIVAFVVPLILAAILRKLHVYKQRLKYYFSDILPKMSNEFMLFLTIGFFGYALGKSQYIGILQAHIVRLSGFNSDIISLFIILIIAGLAILGLHPIITISSLAITLGTVNLGLNTMQLAITLITGYIMYLILSPFSSMVMILSGFSRQNVYKMGLKLNWSYAVVLTILITIIIRLWSEY